MGTKLLSCTSSLPKKFYNRVQNFLCYSLPKALRKALKEIMSSSEHLLEDSLLTSLCTVLQHGLGALRDPPIGERAAAMSEGLFNNISLVSQVSFLMILGIRSPLSSESKFLFTC